MRRFFKNKTLFIDDAYDDSEWNEAFTNIQVIFFEDVNKDSLPDYCLIMETCGSNHEKLNIKISNLIIGQKYYLTFNEWTNGTKNSLYQETWMYGCSVSQDPVTSKSPGKQIFTNMIWECPNIGGFNNGYLEFIATANVMYWVWDFGALTDNIQFKHQISDVLLNIIPPNFDFKNVVVDFSKGTYELLNYTNKQVSFNFTGASGIEILHYTISNLVKNAQYRLTIQENYTGELIEEKYYYGFSVLDKIPESTSVIPQINIPNKIYSTEFIASNNTEYLVCNFGRIADNKKNNFIITIQLEILLPNGEYKLII